MDIVYEADGSSTEPTTDQITITGSAFTNNKADGDGGLMRVSASSMQMAISSTTFTGHTSLLKGGIFYIDTLKKLTLTSVTAEDF